MPLHLLSTPARRLLLAGLLACLPSFIGWSAEKEAATAAAPSLEPVIVGKPVRLTVHPPTLSLHGTRARAQILITGHYADGRVQDLTRATAWSMASSRLASVTNGYLSPLAVGTTTLTAKIGGQSVKVPVNIAATRAEETVSFKYGVLAALTKQGCNSGGCHGTPSGKGGLALSLFAFDPEADLAPLASDFTGRRINAFAPEQSLLLLKPLMQVAHRGGLRLRPGEETYTLLRDWIKQGCRADPPQAPQCTSIEVQAGTTVLKWPVHAQQLAVTARFSDGTVRDITRLATYASSDEAIASVTPDGLVIGTGRGQVAVNVRFLEEARAVTFTLLRERPDFRWSAPPTNNYVDSLVFTRLREMQILPSPTASDEAFVRRVFLDVIGLLPTVAEVEAFLADPRADKRARLVDTLLERPEFATFWALRWGDLLRLSPTQVGLRTVPKFHQWLVRSFAENWPYDRFARALLTGEGSTHEQPAANYWRAAKDTDDATETTAQLFLGVRIACARCHNHPQERWTQNDYYGMSAIFDRVRRRPVARTDATFVWLAQEGEVTQPRTGRVMKPAVPDGGELPVPADADRRVAFADWLADPANPFFAKAEVNRLWAQVMGAGIVEPMDDFRASNPPSHPALLDALAADFRKHGFDRKHVLRVILNSRVYQASAQANEFNADDRQFFSRYRRRVLTAEQLLDAVSQVTGVGDRFINAPAGTRATALPSPEANNAFLSTFGQPPRATACACERSSTATLGQSLQLFNGPLLQAKLKASDNRLRALAAASRPDPEIIQELYLVALSRRPTPKELTTTLNYLKAQPDRTQALEDICWTVLNLDEFLFQH